MSKTITGLDRLTSYSLQIQQGQQYQGPIHQMLSRVYIFSFCHSPSSLRNHNQHHPLHNSFSLALSSSQSNSCSFHLSIPGQTTNTLSSNVIFTQRKALPPYLALNQPRLTCVSSEGKYSTPHQPFAPSQASILDRITHRTLHSQLTSPPLPRQNCHQRTSQKRDTKENKSKWVAQATKCPTTALPCLIPTRRLPAEPVWA